jgi:hypothetical protein
MSVEIQNAEARITVLASLVGIKKHLIEELAHMEKWNKVPKSVKFGSEVNIVNATVARKVQDAAKIIMSEHLKRIDAVLEEFDNMSTDKIDSLLGTYKALSEEAD